MCDDDDQDSRPEERGPYETWRSLDPWHCGLMNILAAHVHETPEARLYFAVIEQALVDVYVLKGAGMDPEDLRWFQAGWGRRFFRTQRFTAMCEACGLDPVWTRECIARYARTLSEFKAKSVAA